MIRTEKLFLVIFLMASSAIGADPSTEWRLAWVVVGVIAALMFVGITRRDDDQ